MKEQQMVLTHGECPACANRGLSGQGAPVSSYDHNVPNGTACMLSPNEATFSPE